MGLCIPIILYIVTLQSILYSMGLCTLIILYIVTLHSILYSMGLAGVRDFDTQKFFEEKQPLCVVYFDVDYSMNPKGNTISVLYIF